MLRALRSLCAALIASPSLATAAIVPQTTIDYAFEIDPLASGIGSAAIVPLDGRIHGRFHLFDRTLTLLPGPDIVPFGSLAQTTTIPQTRIIDATGVIVDASGSYTTSIANVRLGAPTGVVSNGSDASAVAWSAQGSGSLAGNARIDYVLGGSPTTTLVDVSAIASPAANFALPGGTTSISLANAGGARLELPFGLPRTVADLQIDATGLPGLVAPGVASFLQSHVNARLAEPIPALIVATSPVPLPPPPVEVEYIVDPARSFLSTGSLSAPLTGTVGSESVLHTLRFGGESNVSFSIEHTLPVSSLAGTLSGLNYDVRLDELALDFGFDIADGYATHGSLPSLLDWETTNGHLSVQGFASLEFFGLTAAAPFLIDLDLSLGTTLVDGDATVEVLQVAGVETLVIPLEFTGFHTEVLGTNVVFDAGPLGQLATLFALRIAPLIQDRALDAVESLRYAGQLVATRSVDDPNGRAVPEPGTALLMGAALAALWLVRRARNRR